MKRLLLLLLCCILSLFLNGFAQINGGGTRIQCVSPMNNTTFQNEYGVLKNTTNSITKLNNAKVLVTNNCMSSNQVKQIALLFFSDQEKLDFCRASYDKIVDKENFYDVYDAFAYFSTAFRLHDYVLAYNSNNTVNNNVTIHSNITTYDYPNYIYPSHASYVGITGCTYPINESSFYQSYSTYKMSKMSDNAKATTLKDYCSKNCLSTAQVMKLASILGSEALRYDVLKSAFSTVYDRGNFPAAEQLLTTDSYKIEFNNLMLANGISNNDDGNGTVIVNTNCVVTDGDMNDIVSSIKKESFDDSKMTVAKQIISAKKCFTVDQITRIVKLFSFDSSRLEIAKYAYEYCTDKDNYYKVKDAFSFSSSKDELTDFLLKNQ